MEKYYLLTGDDGIVQIVDKAGSVLSTINMPSPIKELMSAFSQKDFDDPMRNDAYGACLLISRLVNHDIEDISVIHDLCEFILRPRVHKLNRRQLTPEWFGIDFIWSGMWLTIMDKMRSDVLAAIYDVIDGTEAKIYLERYSIFILEYLLKRAINGIKSAQEIIEDLSECWFARFVVSMIELPARGRFLSYPEEEAQDITDFGMKVIKKRLDGIDTDVMLDALRCCLEWDYGIEYHLIDLTPLETLIMKLSNKQLAQFQMVDAGDELTLMEALHTHVRDDDYAGLEDYERMFIVESNQKWRHVIELVQERLQ